MANHCDVNVSVSVHMVGDNIVRYSCLDKYEPESYLDNYTYYQPMKALPKQERRLYL